MNLQAKPPAGGTAKGFQNQSKFEFDNTCAPQTKQAQSCPRCERDVKVPWLVAIIYSPAHPVRVVSFCASCAGDLRYASLMRQKMICDEIAERVDAGRRGV